MKIISAKPRHIDSIVNIFCMAFENSISFFTPLNENLKAFFKDVFILLLDVYGKGFMIAKTDEKVCGYIIMVDDIKKLWVQSFSSGFVFKAISNFLKGAYGIDMSTLLRIIKNKLFYLQFEITSSPSAQLLSIAVDPNHHGKGIGQGLLREGIKYIDSLGIKRIKLEARPENIPALRIYEKHGFEVVGETKDLQGKWLIMVREII